VNKVGKTSILLLLACSHYNFLKIDSTSPSSNLRRHTWQDVLRFTSHENATRDYEYSLDWRIGKDKRTGNAKRPHRSKAWSGIGKASQDKKRKNAQIRDKEVRFIDLERVLPARNASKSLFRKVSSANKRRVHSELEEAFCYIFSMPHNIQIYEIGSHVNKKAFLIESPSNDGYSSYNAASGEESVLNILQEIIESPTNSLILIDEIEAGFHPSIQRKVADIIYYISWANKKQFIITTHSPTLMSAFGIKSRRFIDVLPNGSITCINQIAVNAAFSKMDSKAYPLFNLYCEDDIAHFIIKNLLIKLNQQDKYFHRLVNIIESGPANMVKQDYERHKKNFNQMRLKIGYACVFDGDYQQEYSSYHQNSDEHSLFLYPYVAPEFFLGEAYLNTHPNTSIQSLLDMGDHHNLFKKMVDEGLASDKEQALNLCWQAYTQTAEYSTLESSFNEFISKAIRSFTVINDDQ
jgi:hypothetical protein